MPSGALGSINATSEPNVALFGEAPNTGQNNSIKQILPASSDSLVPGELGQLHVPDVRQSTGEFFLNLAPFLRTVDSPAERRKQSRAFDAKMEKYWQGDGTSLPQVHCFYEVLSETAQHHSLIAATTSMRAAGHPVRVWSYSPAKLDFLASHGIEIRPAEEIIPRGLFERVLAGSELRYFSDLFRYAVLYEQGGLWMDSDVILLKPFPFRGSHFLNLQWRGSHKGHFICGNVMYAERHSRHMRHLYEIAVDRFFASNGKEFGDIGPKLLSDYVASEKGAGLELLPFNKPYAL